MDDGRIARIVQSINNVKERKAARSGVNYRRGTHVPEAAIMAWLEQTWPEAVALVLAEPQLNPAQPEPIPEPQEILRSQPFYPKPYEPTPAEIQAEIARMTALEVSRLSLLADGVVIEMPTRSRAESAEPSKGKVSSGMEEARHRLGLAGRILSISLILGLCAVIAWQLSIATVPLYGAVPAMLLILLPMAFIFFIDAKLVRALVLLGFVCADLYSLEAMRQRDASEVEKSAASANPEYLRLSAEHKRIMLEREGLDSVTRVSRLAELRRKAQDISDQMTALERNILTDRGVTSSLTTGKVTLLVRILFLIGMIVLGHALPLQLRSLDLAFSSKKP